MYVFLVPLLFLSVGWFAHEPVSLFSSSILFLFVLSAVLLTKKFNWRQNRIFLLALSIPVSYLLSALINGQNLSSFFLGGYQRNFGIATLIALSLLLILGSAPDVNFFKYRNYGLLITLIIANVYGYLQYFDLDPLPWSNPFKAVSLTLGNPNFAGALFGCLSIVAISILVSTQKLWAKVLSLGLYLSTIFLAVQTKSLQAVLLIILSTLTFLFIVSIGRVELHQKIIKYVTFSSILSSTIAIISIFGFDKFLSLKEKIFFQGSIPQRLDYWQNGIAIWKDHPIFGVGVDQFQRYAAFYRNPTQIVRDGNFVIPDKSHNVLIDHLANGGLLAAVLWLSLVISIFWVSYRLIQLRVGSRPTIATLVAVWSAYVAQSLISPDQIVLAVIGYTSGGILLGIYNKEIAKSKNLDLNQKENPFLVRAVAAFLLVISFFIFSKALIANAHAKQMVAGNLIDKQEILNVINEWPNPKTTELIGIELLKDANNCPVVVDIADKLIAIDSRNAQGWFMKAVCANFEKDFTSAISYVDSSLKYDPLNPYYLVSKAKLELAANRIDSAEKTIAKAKSVNINERDIRSVETSILSLKNKPK